MADLRTETDGSLLAAATRKVQGGTPMLGAESVRWLRGSKVGPSRWRRLNNFMGWNA
jgi:hypothetical protein